MKYYYQRTYRAHIILIEYKTREDVLKELNLGIKEKNKIIVEQAELLKKDDEIIDRLYDISLSGYQDTIEYKGFPTYIIGINIGHNKDKSYKNSVLVHELVHLISTIYKDRGIETIDLNDNSNEKEAYLMEELYIKFQF